jgi:hypothetical protein
MLKFSGRATAIVAALFVGGCAVYPLPEDVMPYKSEQIAALIRCQTRDALRNVALRAIEAARSPVVYGGRTREEFLAWLQEDPDRFRELRWEKFVPELRDPFVFYKDTAVSYDFTIDTMEMNSAGVSLTLLKQLTGGSNSLGLTAKNDRTREVSRHFRSYDSFDSLVRLMRPDACYNMPRYPNMLYPSNGLLRIDSLVNSFFVANQWENLVDLKGEDLGTAQMTDTLTFTTKSTGNVDPSSAADSVLNTVVPSSVSVNFDNNRQDEHTIIILISLPAKKKDLPQFDGFGRILAPGAARRAAASVELDRQKEFNTQNALIRLGTGVGRLPSP